MASGQGRKSITRDQLIRFFDAMSTVFERPEAKQRVANAVAHGEDPVAVSNEVQREGFEQLGIGSKVGLENLVQVKGLYQDDRECLVKYLTFVESEELFREEAVLGQQKFQQKRIQAKKLEEQQLTLLRQLRKLPADVQEGFIHGLSRNTQGMSASTFFNCVTTEDAKAPP